MAEPYWASDDGDVTLYLGKCEKVLPGLPANSVDAIVTDPPAAISFMGRAWDGNLGGRDKWVAWLAECMEAAARVLKPGGHLLVWSLPRTSHWTAFALEDAGLEIRDCILHLFGSGFPKSLDVSKAIDKAAGAEREVVGVSTSGLRSPGFEAKDRGNVKPAGQRAAEFDITDPATVDAARWEGWGTALKPGQEMWWLARKPLKGTVAACVLEFGTGALNIAACTVATADNLSGGAHARNGSERHDGAEHWRYKIGGAGEYQQPDGRWPANVVFTHSQCDWYALRHDISEDTRQTILAYYRSAEGVREVRDGLLRDAIRAGQTPVLFTGLREHGAARSPGEAVGRDDLPAVRGDIRDLSGVGAQRPAPVLLGQLPARGTEGQEPEPDGETAHRYLAGQDGHEPGHQGALFPVEGRPVPERRRLLVRDGRPAAAGDAGTGQADDQGPVHPGAPDSRRSGNRPPDYQGRSGPSHQRREDGQPSGEPDRDQAGGSLAGAPRDREAVRDADSRGGDPSGGECVLAVPDGLIPPGWLNHFTYLDSAACDGRCAPDCPAGELDRQSGVTASRKGVRPPSYGATSGVHEGWRRPAHADYHDKPDAGFDDTGGASRFYPVFRYQAKAPASERPRLEDGTAHETVKPLGLMTWLVRLVTPPGGTVLDLFAGSGPVAEACIIEGFRCVLIEQDPKSARLIVRRLSKPIQPAMFGDAL